MKCQNEALQGKVCGFGAKTHIRTPETLNFPKPYILYPQPLKGRPEIADGGAALALLRGLQLEASLQKRHEQRAATQGLWVLRVLGLATV